jgi:pimeloyl-ACP methyl ester carboxylesterase
MKKAFPFSRTARRLPLAGLALSLALTLAACGGGDDDSPAPPAPSPGQIVTNDAYTAPALVQAQASSSRRLVHWMTGQDGRPVKATALLFQPTGTAPAGGWPVVVWVHGTQSVGTGAPAATVCSASESATMDGGLTAAGFTSYYADTVAALLGAGYAVVAPDLEGYGAQAQADGTRAAYYKLTSGGHAVAAALEAAHRASPQLSLNWASVGHSEGGHQVMGLETTAGEASRYAYRGTVAVAPYANIASAVQTMGALITADPANALNYRASQENTVLMFGTVLNTQNSAWPVTNAMDADLVALVPQARTLCILQQFGLVAQTVATKGMASFVGFKAGWATDATMSAFLQANDVGVKAGFSVSKPTLVLQGTADPFVFESLQTPYMQRLQGAGMPVTYRVYTGADHGDVLVQGRADMLAFLRGLFP